MSRTPDGTFAPKGSGTTKAKKPRKPIKLTRAEYAHVMSEINTNLTDERRSKATFYQAIGSYLYYVQNE